MALEEMTAEQAVEAAKGLTFEQVWAVVMQTQRMIQESQAAMQKQAEKSQRKTDKILSDLSKNIGGLGNTLGRFTEAMFSTELWEKFRKLGYTFTRQAFHVKFIDESENVFAEVDFFIENGIYALLVEVKTELSNEDVDEHIERIGKIRKHLDARGDSRKLIGAVAGGIVSENARNYAQRKGFYVIQQNGDTVSIASSPVGFKAREW